MWLGRCYNLARLKRHHNFALIFYPALDFFDGTYPINNFEIETAAAFSITTFSIKTLSIIKLRIITLSIIQLSTMTIRIITFSIVTLNQLI